MCLLSVFRSPGGTPVRFRPKSPPASDPASIIAAALKKRFAKMHANSPEKDINDDSNDFSSSPENTPQTSRKSRSEILKRRIVPEENFTQNVFKTLRKTSARAPQPQATAEKSSLPVVSPYSFTGIDLGFSTVL